LFRGASKLAAITVSMKQGGLVAAMRSDAPGSPIALYTILDEMCSWNGLEADLLRLLQDECVFSARDSDEERVLSMTANSEIDDICVNIFGGVGVSMDTLSRQSALSILHALTDGFDELSAGQCSIEDDVARLIFTANSQSATMRCRVKDQDGSEEILNDAECLAMLPDENAFEIRMPYSDHQLVLCPIPDRLLEWLAALRGGADE
jgi:hypothetical protein